MDGKRKGKIANYLTYTVEGGSVSIINLDRNTLHQIREWLYAIIGGPCTFRNLVLDVTKLLSTLRATRTATTP